MKFNNDFFKSRHFIVFSLVLMLILIGSINYRFSQKNLLETSNELKEYEKSMMQMYEDENKTVDKNEKDGKLDVSKDSEVKVVDSNKDVVNEKVKETSTTINKQMQESQALNKDTYFVEMKLNRDKEMSTLEDELQAIINNPSSSSDSKDQASSMKLQLLKNREVEMNIENLLIARGFESPIVYISTEGISIMVKNENLSNKQLGKIYDVATTESKLPMDKIKIIPTKR